MDWDDLKARTEAELNVGPGKRDAATAESAVVAESMPRPSVALVKRSALPIPVGGLNRRPPPDSRSVGRPPRLELWSVLLRGAESAGQAATEVAQEARIAYLLIIISFLVDWAAWFILVFGLFHNFIANQLFRSGPETGVTVNTVIPVIACAILGSLYPLAFAIYELNFYRSDLSREDTQPLGKVQSIFSNHQNARRIRAIGMVAVLVIMLLLGAFGTILVQLPNAIEISLWVILLIIFAMGLYRFGTFIGFVFGVRSVIIVLAAYVTSYPLEMMVYRERINEKHIQAKRIDLTNRISLRIASLGSPPPRSFDLFRIDEYLNTLSKDAGTIHSRYSMCFSSRMQKILGRRTLREVGELDAEKARLESSLLCGNICNTRVFGKTGQRDLERCLEGLDRVYPGKGSGGLRAVCLPDSAMSEARRLNAVQSWISARKSELADVQARLGPIAVAAIADAHTSCLEDPEATAPQLIGSPAAAPSAQSPQQPQLGVKSLVHDIGVVDAWRQRLVVKRAGDREILTLDERYQPHLCADATREETLEGFCIDAPGLSEQILIMTDLQKEKENMRARAFALFIAMVLPLLVILNKLLASEELHNSLSRASERSADGSESSKNVLMGTVISRDTTLQRREQALLRLYELNLLEERDIRMIAALGEDDLIAILRRLYRED